MDCMRRSSLAILARDRCDCRTKASDRGHILCPGSPPTFLAATPQQGRKEPEPRVATNECADPLGSPELVGGDRQEVSPKRGEATIHPPGPLDRIDVQQALGRMDDPRCVGYGLDSTRFVVGQHDRYECTSASARDRPHAPGQRTKVDPTVRPHLDEPIRSGANRPPLRGYWDVRSPTPATNRSRFPPVQGRARSIFASVPPEVKTTQPGSTPTNCATSDRARSIQRRAARPSAWTEDAFPPDLNVQPATPDEPPAARVRWRSSQDRLASPSSG